MHCFIGESIYGPTLKPQELMENMKEVGIDKAVIIPFTPPDLNFSKANEYTLEVIEKFPKRFFGFGRVDPRLKKETLTEIEKIAKKPKLRGIFLNPFEQAFRINDRMVYPVFEKCSELEIPLMVESGYPIVSRPIQISNVAESFPELPIIMTHGGQLQLSGLGQADAINALLENVNLFVETSCITVTGKDGFLEQCLTDVEVEKVLFGSSFPLANTMVEMNRLEFAGISEREKKLIFWQNGKRILGESI